MAAIARQLLRPELPLKWQEDGMDDSVARILSLLEGGVTVEVVREALRGANGNEESAICNILDSATRRALSSAAMHSCSESTMIDLESANASCAASISSDPGALQSFSTQPVVVLEGGPDSGRTVPRSSGSTAGRLPSEPTSLGREGRGDFGGAASRLIGSAAVRLSSEPAMIANGGKANPAGAASRVSRAAATHSPSEATNTALRRGPAFGGAAACLSSEVTLIEGEKKSDSVCAVPVHLGTSAAPRVCNSFSPSPSVSRMGEVIPPVPMTNKKPQRLLQESAEPCQVHGERRKMPKDSMEWCRKLVKKDTKRAFSLVEEAKREMATGSSGLSTTLPTGALRCDQHEDPKRAGVCKRIFEALSKEVTLAECPHLHSLTSEIEHQLHSKLNKKDYIFQCRSLLFNLKQKDNARIRKQLVSGAIKPTEVPRLTADEMASDNVYCKKARIRQDAMEEIQLDWDLKHNGDLHDGMLECPKCGGKKTRYEQAQIGHGLDEPPTTFVFCFQCSNRWKFDDVGASADAEG